MAGPTKPTGERSQQVRALVLDGLGAGRAFRPEVTSKSMAPLIRPGDQVEVQGVEGPRLHPGNIVVLSAPDGTWITHRLLEWIGEGTAARLVTKGDQAITADPVWDRSAVIGRVRGVSRAGRYLPLDRDQGQRVGQVLAALVLWEWRLAGRWRRGLGRRILHRAVLWLAATLAWLAWRRSLVASRPD